MTALASDAGRARRGIVPILLCVVPFSQIPLDAYTPGLPQMVVDLATDSASMQNTVTAYMLGMSLALVPVGIASDTLGRRNVLLAGLSMLIAMSFACAMATSASLLLGLRFLQGIGGCTCLVVAYAVAADCYRGPELTAISGLLGAAWGLAPVLAPAAGGFIVDLTSWRGVFVVIAIAASTVAMIVVFLLPETLPAERRAPFDPRRTAGILRDALLRPGFLAFVLVFAAAASAQLAFGVVAPFFYQTGLGYSAAIYGLVALGLGGVNLAGELGCAHFAQLLPARMLGFGAFALFVAGAGVLTGTGMTLGLDFVSITLGGALVLGGCGVLCPMMYGMGLGLFERNHGLIGGLISALCYLAVSGAMAIAAVLPEETQAPIGLLYLGLCAIAGVLLAISLPAARTQTQQGITS
ncbi:multidrug effflux MFS transporter [Bradyrhizobium sp. BR 10261]|uniref:multidrug effflux MFS transporter n=1 Tax=Bradyrhizobium sp. BR 10261 TaxID=2749992 RepID=UPI001C64785C|nr:multidrug effflux MFS transporter [Bradyrhizobium sp. BR 10261]MBW7962224.1 multidrug effflux MFS transporter [Bradyrhizobium sp. BR 10261]